MAWIKFYKSNKLTCKTQPLRLHNYFTPLTSQVEALDQPKEKNPMKKHKPKLMRKETGTAETHNPTHASSQDPHGSTASQASSHNQASRHGNSHHRNSDAASVHIVSSANPPPSAPVANISIPFLATLRAPQCPSASASNPSLSNSSSSLLSCNTRTPNVTTYTPLYCNQHQF